MTSRRSKEPLSSQGPDAAGDRPGKGGSGARPVEIIGIQYLRGVAALFVVIFHISRQIYELQGRAPLRALQSGVDIFFVISGFVMIISTDAGRKTSAADFIAKRIARIAPLYWAATLAMIAVLLVAPQFVRTTRMTMPYAMASLAFVVSDMPGYKNYYAVLLAPGWTLALEMFFYLVFTFGLAAGRRGWTLVGVVSLPIVGLTLWGGLAHPAGIAQFYSGPIMLEFVFGMVLGAAFLAGRIAIPHARAIILLAIAMAMLLLLPLPDDSWRWLRFGLPALLLVGASLSVRFELWRLPLLFGDASYSLYLTHFFVLSALVQFWKKAKLASPRADFALYPLGIVLCCACAVLCWRYIEMPLSRTARRLLVPRRPTIRIALVKGD